MQQAADAIALYYDIILEKHHTAEHPSHPNTISTGHDSFKDAGQYADKEAFLLSPAYNRLPFQSITPIPEGSREKKADSGKVLLIAERDPKYRKNKTFKIGNKSGNPADEPHKTVHQSHHTKKTSNASRQAKYIGLANEIQVRHYSPKVTIANFVYFRQASSTCPYFLLYITRPSLLNNALSSTASRIDSILIGWLCNFIYRFRSFAP